MPIIYITNYTTQCPGNSIINKYMVTLYMNVGLPLLSSLEIILKNLVASEVFEAYEQSGER